MKQTLIYCFLLTAVISILLVTLGLAAGASSREKTVQVSTGIEIFLDGVKLHPTDIHGAPAEPFLYQGTVYIPLRALAQSLGREIRWDPIAGRVYIRTPR